MKPNIATSEFIERIVEPKVLKDVINARETTHIALGSPSFSLLIKISLIVAALIPPIQILFMILRFSYHTQLRYITY